MRNSSFSRKILLTLAFILVFSSKIFAGFGVGVKGGGDLSTLENYWRVGTTIGIGNMQGRPFIIDVLFFYSGNDETLSVKPTFDWHFLVQNLGIVQLYLGAGLGTEFVLPTSNKWTTSEPFGIGLMGRIPLGLKIFLGSVELFTEVTPQLGWAHLSMKNNGKRTGYDRFYWTVGLYAGARIWF